MFSKPLIKVDKNSPTVFDDFFMPWNEWFDNSGRLWNKILTVPAANIVENKNSYEVSIAVPGMTKEDFKVDVEGLVLTISCERETEKETVKEKKFTRNEYNYTSFSRSFNLPEDVDKDKIDATYENGILKIVIPCTEKTKKIVAKQIAIH